MASIEIKDLEELIAPILDHKECVSAVVTKLTSAGDNYGSLILAVDIATKDAQGQREEIQAVAKVLPQNKFIQELFNSPRTFKNEVGFYSTIAPLLRQFQHEQGMDNLISSFPDFYCARNSLIPSSTKVDDDAVLLIKNIKREGFSILDRTVGFDLEQSKLILLKIAELHGTSMALRLLKPEVFNKKIGEFFEPYRVFAGDEEAGNKMIDSIIESIKDDDFCVRNLDKIRTTLENNLMESTIKNDKRFLDSRFTTIVHSDMWTNNIMVKLVDNRIIDVKFVDYQLYALSSLARDVIFFLCSSVQSSALQQHCDTLLAYYYDNFISYWKKLKCHTSPFTYDEFLEEIKRVIQQNEFFHIMLMLGPIHANQKDVKEVEDLELNDMLNQRLEVTNACKEKAGLVIREFIRRGWL